MGQLPPIQDQNMNATSPCVDATYTPRPVEVKTIKRTGEISLEPCYALLANDLLRISVFVGTWRREAPQTNAATWFLHEKNPKFEDKSSAKRRLSLLRAGLNSSRRRVT
jgi:hypothetical protein